MERTFLYTVITFKEGVPDTKYALVSEPLGKIEIYRIYRLIEDGEWAHEDEKDWADIHSAQYAMNRIINGSLTC